MREIKDEPELPSVIGLGSYMLDVKPSVKFFLCFLDTIQINQEIDLS